MKDDEIRPKIPNEISAYFSEAEFVHYPLIRIPQVFSDDRGIISNIADGSLGDVAVIFSSRGSIRANHFHHEDWHLSYLVYGQMKYVWKNEDSRRQARLVNSGELIFTPKKTPHRMEFIEDTCFIAISKMSRTTENYELDTVRLAVDFFDELS